MPIDRYSDLPLSIRRFLELCDDRRVADLDNAIILIRDLMCPPADGQVSALNFLRNAHPRTLEWLRNAREDEINQLDEAIRLVRAARTVGKFLRWVLVTFIAMLVLFSQLGEWLLKLLKRP